MEFIGIILIGVCMIVSLGYAAPIIIEDSIKTFKGGADNE